MEGKKGLVIYSRKSRFTGKGESVENQVEMCRQYIRLHYGQEEAKKAFIYEDEGFSGGNLERPQFKKMMEAAEAGKFSAVVVYRLDRISRNIGDFAGLIQKLREWDVDFISIKEQFDTSSPMGRAMMFISSVFSQLERETIAERIRDNMAELAKTGRWLGGMAPTGYVSESFSYKNKDGKTKKACRLKLLPEEGQTVKRIFQTFLETGSLSGTQARLLQWGTVTKTGKEFSRFAVKAILSNPVYMAADEKAWEYFSERKASLYPEKERFDGRGGVMVYNRSLQQPGKTSRIRPVEEWIVAAGEHRPIVDGETWVKVQEMLEKNKSKSYKRPRSQNALLSGLLVCGSCGNFMRPKATSRKNEKGEARYVYLCCRKEKSKGCLCSMKNADGNCLDEGILKALSGMKEDEDEFLLRLEKKGKKIRTGCEKKEKLEELKEETGRLEKEIRNMALALAEAKGMKAEAYILEEMERLCERKQLVEQAVREEEEISFPEAEIWKDISPFQTEGHFSLSVEEKRQAIRSLVEKVVWDGETAQVFFLS